MGFLRYIPSFPFWTKKKLTSLRCMHSQVTHGLLSRKTLLITGHAYDKRDRLSQVTKMYAANWYTVHSCIWHQRINSLNFRRPHKVSAMSIFRALYLALPRATLYLGCCDAMFRSWNYEIIIVSPQGIDDELAQEKTRSMPRSSAEVPHPVISRTDKRKGKN